MLIGEKVQRAIYHCTTDDNDTIEIPPTEILDRIFTADFWPWNY
jgi:hypothetical protein